VRRAIPRIENPIKHSNASAWENRDATAILIAYRHGLRASELVALRWDDIDLATGRLHARRAKGGAASVHPIGARESRALRRLQRDMIAAVTMSSPYVFVSERGSPLSVAGYQRMVARAGEAARFNFLIHSHMLRHGCGYKLANDGQDTRAIQHYLGHRSTASTVRYTQLAPDRFKGFWKD
jgi:type 1 fimbriae regulatory protein FimB/type 1 fimbriae regulatory protein FimE